VGAGAQLSRAARAGEHALPHTLANGTWRVDPARSRVGFEVKHLGLGRVKGSFGELEGTIEVGRAGIRAHGSVSVASVDTRDGPRDGFLRSEQFFDAARHPEIGFSSTSARWLDERTLELVGELTIRSRAQPLTLLVAVEGGEEGRAGERRARLRTSAEISRSDYGLRFDVALGSGNLAVGEHVKIVIDVPVVKAAARRAAR